jgi:osmotically-inducible protein OsmY
VRWEWFVMALEDAYQTRAVKHELTRRNVDMSDVDVRVIHGICYLRGTKSKFRSHPEVDLEQEGEVIRKVIRQVRGIRNVVWEVRNKYSPLDRKRSMAGYR